MFAGSYPIVMGIGKNMSNHVKTLEITLPWPLLDSSLLVVPWQPPPTISHHFHRGRTFGRLVPSSFV